MISHSELPLIKVNGGNDMDSFEVINAIESLCKRLEEMEEWALLTDATRIKEGVRELVFILENLRE